MSVHSDDAVSVHSTASGTVPCEATRFMQMTPAGITASGIEVRLKTDPSAGVTGYYILLEGQVREIYCDITCPSSLEAALDHARTGLFVQPPAIALEVVDIMPFPHPGVHLGETANGYALYARRLESGETCYITNEHGLQVPVYLTDIPEEAVRFALDHSWAAHRSEHQASR